MFAEWYQWTMQIYERYIKMTEDEQAEFDREDEEAFTAVMVALAFIGH